MNTTEDTDYEMVGSPSVHSDGPEACAFGWKSGAADGDATCPSKRDDSTAIHMILECRVSFRLFGYCSVRRTCIRSVDVGFRWHGGAVAFEVLVGGAHPTSVSVHRRAGRLSEHENLRGCAETLCEFRYVSGTATLWGWLVGGRR